MARFDDKSHSSVSRWPVTPLLHIHHSCARHQSRHPFTPSLLGCLSSHAARHGLLRTLLLLGLPEVAGSWLSFQLLVNITSLLLLRFPPLAGTRPISHSCSKKAASVRLRGNSQHEAQLLQGPTFSFGEQGIHQPDLYQDPYAVNDVVLPPNRVERNWVDVCVEKYSPAHSELLDGNAFRSLVIRKDLYQVSVGQGIPADVVTA